MKRVRDRKKENESLRIQWGVCWCAGGNVLKMVEIDPTCRIGTLVVRMPGPGTPCWPCLAAWMVEGLLAATRWPLVRLNGPVHSSNHLMCLLMLATLFWAVMRTGNPTSVSSAAMLGWYVLYNCVQFITGARRQAYTLWHAFSRGITPVNCSAGLHCR